MDTATINNETTFQNAIPYGIGTLALGIGGVVAAVVCTKTAAIVAGVAAALFGAYAFFGVIACASRYSHHPAAFRMNVHQYMITAAGAAISHLISSVAQIVLVDLVSSFLDRRRQAR